MSAQTHPFCLRSGAVCVPATPVSLHNCPPAASTRGTGEAASRCKLPRRPGRAISRPHSSPGALRPSWGAGLGAPPSRPRRLLSHAGGARAARAALPPHPGQDLTTVLGSPPHARASVMAERRPRRSFPELTAYLSARGAAAALGSSEAAAGAPVANWSRGGREREAPVARNRRDGKRKAPGIYNQNVG